MKTSKKIINIVASGLIGLFMAWAICTFVFQPIQVQGISMFPNYKDGQVKFVSKFNKEYSYNDVVVVNTQSGYIIKRVIGLEGDTIAIDNKSGQVIRNCERLDEEYLSEHNQTIASNKEKVTTYNVPDGCYFVMGDNRRKSLDSRSDSIGYITTENIIGRVL